jgi:hypothetical protein
VLSIGIFFSLMVTGLASSLPHTLFGGLTAQGVPATAANGIAGLPPIGVLFAAFLGYNPMQQLLGPGVLSQLPASHAAYLTGRQFFPSVITQPFHAGIGIAFGFAIACCVLGAVASALTGGASRAGRPQERESLGSQLAAVAAEASGEEPSELVVPDMVGGEQPTKKLLAGGADVGGWQRSSDPPPGLGTVSCRLGAGEQVRAGPPRPCRG